MREWTNKVLKAMDEGMLDPAVVAEMCLSFMSEDDVADMVRANDLVEYLGGDEDEDEDYEPDVDELTEWNDYDPDC